MASSNFTTQRGGGGSSLRTVATFGAVGTTIADTGASTGNNLGWLLQANIVKFGASGSNTQVAQQLQTVVGSTHGGGGLAQALTLAENGLILIAVTGNAATTATDIAINQFTVTSFN